MSSDIFFKISGMFYVIFIKLVSSILDLIWDTRNRIRVYSLLWQGTNYLLFSTVIQNRPNLFTVSKSSVPEKNMLTNFNPCMDPIKRERLKQTLETRNCLVANDML